MTNVAQNDCIRLLERNNWTRLGVLENPDGDYAYVGFKQGNYGVECFGDGSWNLLLNGDVELTGSNMMDLYEALCNLPR